MKKSILSTMILTAIFGMSVPALAEVVPENCESVMLTDMQRGMKADVVFEGTVESAMCTCMPLATGDDDYGSKAECTDVVNVTTQYKGTVSPKVTIKTLATLDQDPKADMSKSDCKGKVDDRDTKLIGTSQVYFLMQSGEFYDPAPVNACDD